MSESNGHIKLNLGAGDVNLPGYINLDGKNGHSLYPLAYDDQSAYEVRASHVLEHWSHRETLNVLREWARVLKPGGILKVAVPNFEYIAKSYIDRQPSPHPLHYYLMGAQIDKRDFHQAVFDEPSLRDLMYQAGLVDVTQFASEANDCSALPVSLNLMGRKPGAEVAVSPSPMPAPTEPEAQFVAGRWHAQNLKEVTAPTVVAMVMSRPRFGSLYAADCLATIAHRLGAPLLHGAGSWWEQGLTRSILEALKYRSSKGMEAEFILTADYDTIAVAEDVIKMITLLYQNPQYDCVVPMQARRGKFQEILARTAGPVDFTQALIPITSGHFGLTVFRRRVFEKLKAPWFLNVPAEDGHWGEGRTDADIFFWEKLMDSGFKAALAPHVSIGHMDEHVAYAVLEDGKIVKKCMSIFEWLETRTVPGVIEK